MASDSNNFRYWNREGQWLDFDWSGLEPTATGSLRLNSLPVVDNAAAAGGAQAVAPDGSIFVADADSGRVEMIEPCSHERIQLPLPGGMKPVRLAASPAHSMLLVADAASNQVRGFDWTNWAEMLAWDFDALTDVAAAADGTVYVVDGGRVDRLTIAGDAAPFGDAADAVNVALDGDSVFVRTPLGAIVEFDKRGARVADVATGLAGERGLAAGQQSVYAADGVAIAVFRRYRSQWVRVSAAQGGDAFSREGWLRSNALSTGRTVSWHRLEAIVDLPAGTMVEIAYAIGPANAPPPVDLSSPQWRKPGQGLTDFALGGAEANALWVVVHFLGDGTATPELRQLRTEHDHEGYLPHLPEIYREPEAVDPLARLLALYESMFGGVERSLDELAAWLDPGAAPEAALPWLTSYLGLEGAPGREQIRDAFQNSARRGTPAALRKAIEAETGVQAAIEEPILQSNWWTLESGQLGLDTALAGAEPQGAVVGTTAVADRSHLSADEIFGAALFDEMAYRFSVLVHRSEVECVADMNRVRAVVEREKPAHTMAMFCLIEPRMRIGYQATLGVDSVLGGGDPAPSPLGSGALVLAGPSTGRLGETMATGVTTRV